MDSRQRIEALENLSELRRSKHISDQEFDAAKARLFSSADSVPAVPVTDEAGADFEDVAVEDFGDEPRREWFIIALKTSFITVPLIGVAAVYLYNSDNSHSAADYVVTANTLNCRAEPNVESQRLEQFPNGARVNVSGSSDGWSRIESGETVCWVASEFLSPANSQSPMESAPANAFAIPTTPTPISRLQCHMGNCFWSQVLGVEHVEDFGDGELRRVILRNGRTFTQDGIEYPKSVRSSDIEFWERDVEYLACSITNPAAISHDPETQEFRLEPLNVASPAGYQTRAASLYRLVCHGMEPDDASEEELLAMGYFNDLELSSYSYHPTLRDALTSLDGK